MSALKDTADDLVAALGERAGAPEVCLRLDRLADELQRWCRSETHGLSVPGVDGAPPWYGQETSAWRLCERVRAATTLRFGGRPPVELVHPLERIVGMHEVGKGRQAWALFALEVGKAEAARRLGVHLDDEDVSAHVLKGLARYRVRGFEAEARRIADSSTSVLARRNAKKYLLVLDRASGATG